MELGMQSAMKTDVVLWMFLSLLLLLHSSKAHKASEESFQASLVMFLGGGPQSVLSLLLLAVTVTLSVVIYLWVLRYICIGCCQPVAVGIDPEARSPAL
ncbi:uncharacterized protein LOC144213775 isoform X2 [Stigmatopora nigra]